jgi:endoglucanase
MSRLRHRAALIEYRWGRKAFSGAIFMRSIVRVVVVASLVGFVSAAWAADEAPKIRLNTVGYLPDGRKQASIAATCKAFTVVRVKDSAKVLEGTTSGPAVNADTGEQLYTADFSALKDAGEYRLDVADVGQSAPFRIAADVYAQPFHTAMLGMYLWRCGSAVSAKYDGKTYAHAACHTNDAWLDFATGQHTHLDGTKGWHDAGDYNKYVVNAGVSVGAMFRAWEDFGGQLAKLKLDIPETGGKLPDFLAEIKWELDWLLTMQAPDGSVYHKVSTKGFGGFIMPELEKDDRYFTPWSSAATADFVAMTAAAARIYRPFDADFADRCLAAARKSYDFLKAHPENHEADLKGFSTGGYQTSDPDDRLWAAAELWETTGEAAFLADFEKLARAKQSNVDKEFDWGNVKNLGLFTYLGSRRAGRDADLVAQLRQSLIATADGIVKTAAAHGYARPLGIAYWWGCNGVVARQTVILQAANRLSPKAEYTAACLDALNHLFGRNVHGRSYVTGLGFRPPLHPHDRRSGADKLNGAWPGYLVGGPEKKATDWSDVQGDFRTNEICINWNTALIYALACALPPAGQ